MKKAYVTALVAEVLSGKPVEDMLRELKALMERRGHSRLWSQVLRAALRELTVKERRTQPQLTVARTGSVQGETLKKALETIGAAADSVYLETVDETLVGGFTVRARGTLLDTSYKRALLKLYEKITQ